MTDFGGKHYFAYPLRVTAVHLENSENSSQQLQNADALAAGNMSLKMLKYQLSSLAPVSYLAELLH